MDIKVFESQSLKPIIIVPPDTFAGDGLQALRDNGLCVVEAANPSAVRFMEPIPSIEGYGHIERAAIEFTRKMLNWQWTNESTFGKAAIRSVFLECLMPGSPLDSNPTRAEREKEIYEDSKLEEIRKIAREDARAEREAKKAPKKT